MQKYFTQKYYSDKRNNATTRTKALFALGWVSILWGTSWLASKKGVEHMPALQLAGVRQIIAGSLFVIFFLLRKQALPRGRQWIHILILSLLNFMLSNGLSTWGIKYISSGLGSIMSAIFPLWLVIISMFKGRHLPRRALIGMILGFGGVCIIFYEHLHDFLNADFRLGIFLSLTATLTWAIGTLYTKEQALSFNPYYSLGFQMLISGTALFIISEATGLAIPLREIPTVSWWAISYLVVFGSILTFVAYLYALQNLPAALTSIYAYINPIVAVLLGAAILNEKLTVYIAVGGAITILGVYLVNNSLRKIRH